MINEEFDCVIDINADKTVQSVLFSTEYYGHYYAPIDWKIENSKLILSMNDEANRAVFIFSLVEDDVLEGTYEQYGSITDISLNKISNVAETKGFYRAYGKLTKKRIAQLNEFSEFSDDGITIPFTYTLNQREKCRGIIDEYGLDSIAAGYSDVALMMVLMNWVCDNFQHDGGSGMPKQRDIISIIDFANNNPDGVNCRLLSIILAELCRVYGIEAKHITCMPKEADFDDCHVVVHAFSKELNQWIMLDPTYRLILKNNKGEYINLQMLRQSFIDGIEIIPNSNAGWNGNYFDVFEYKSYMAKNTFRFSCATDFSFGSEEGSGGNIQNMLIPTNYTEDKAERTTTSERAFWKTP